MISRLLRHLKLISAIGWLLGASIAASASPLLYTVSDLNELMSIDVNGHILSNAFTAITKGVTQDSGGGIVRRIRGLAYDDTNSVMYGMTREGDLVKVNLSNGTTTHVYTLTTNPPGEFWSGLAFDGVSKLYTANTFGAHEFVEIQLAPTITESVLGSTTLTGFPGVQLQMLGFDFYPTSAPATPPTSNGSHPTAGVLYGSNRSNDNIATVSTINGSVSFPFGNHTIGVPNLQEIAFHPVSGLLYSIHDHFSSSNNATLSTYDFSTEMATELGELPFGIVEQGPCCGNDTYGWGGLAFAPLAVPEPGSLLLSCVALASLIGTTWRRRQIFIALL